MISSSNNKKMESSNCTNSRKTFDLNSNNEVKVHIKSIENADSTDLEE